MPSSVRRRRKVFGSRAPPTPNVALVWNANSEEIARYEADGFGRRIMGLHASTQEVVVVADLGGHARRRRAAALRAWIGPGAIYLYDFLIRGPLRPRSAPRSIAVGR